MTQHWADADWAPPTASAGRPGAPQFLSASVFRRGSREPLSGYSVRYRILDGPPAQFAPAQSVEAVVPASGDGVAPVVLSQPAPQPGRNRIGIELLGKEGEVVARGETYADWQAPLAALPVPPPAVPQLKVWPSGPEAGLVGARWCIKCRCKIRARGRRRT